MGGAKKLEQKIHHAERIVTASYHVRVALDGARFKVTSYDEICISQEEYKDFGGRIDVANPCRSTVLANTIKERLENDKRHYEALAECIPVAKVIFGDEVGKAVELLADHHIVLFNVAKVIIGLDDSVSKGDEWLEGVFSRLDQGEEESKNVHIQLEVIENECIKTLRHDNKKSLSRIFRS